MALDKFKLYFASVDINYRCIKDTPTKNWLTTFYHLRGKKHRFIVDFLDDCKYGLKRLGINEERSLFLDSGAFSFQNAAGCIPGRTNKDTYGLATNDLLTYAYDYLEFIKAYGHYFNIIAEIDVDYIIDVHKTKYLFDILQRINDEILRKNIRPVWHIPRGEQVWRDDVLKHDYVGIEGHSRHKDDPISFYNQFLKTAHAANTQVHGFAFTHLQLLRRCPFDSVDSASWMLQAANGTIKTQYGVVAISARQLEVAEVDGIMNWHTLQGRDKKVIDEYIRERGFTPEQLIEHWLPRAAINTYYYMWLEDEINRHWDKELKRPKVYQDALFDLKGNKYKSTDADVELTLRNHKEEKV